MSYNFNPQPSFSRTSGGLSTASMHTVVPPTINRPVSLAGTYQLGAVRLGPTAQLSGSSALNGNGSGAILGQFTKGVISFWARYNSSDSPTGDSAKIIQTKGPVGSPPPSNNLTQCGSQNPTVGGLAGGFLMQSMGILMGVFSVDLYLIDGATGSPLLGASLPYVNGQGTTDTIQWVNFGAFGTMVHPPLSYWMGEQFGVFWNLAAPCGGLITTYGSGAPVTLGILNSQADLPQPPSGFALVRTGPDPPPFPVGTIYDTAADVWLATTTSVGGTPTNGWHHYICSFDTSQIVSPFGSPQIRAQLAMDRGGGPFGGHKIYDTAAIFATPNAQPVINPMECFGVTGALASAIDDEWIIAAPVDASVDFAYCYMGIVPDGGSFFDLTVPGHLDYFITPQLIPQDLGFQGSNIPTSLLLCNWMHTGNMTFIPDFSGGSSFPCFTINAPNGRAWTISGGNMTSTDGPPVGA